MISKSPGRARQRGPTIISTRQIRMLRQRGAQRIARATRAAHLDFPLNLGPLRMRFARGDRSQAVLASGNVRGAVRGRLERHARRDVLGSGGGSTGPRYTAFATLRSPPTSTQTRLSTRRATPRWAPGAEAPDAAAYRQVLFQKVVGTPVRGASSGLAREFRRGVVVAAARLPPPSARGAVDVITRPPIAEVSRA